MFHQDFRRQSQVSANLTHFVLEQVAQGFDQSKWHFFRQAAHVVVRLDGRRRALHGHRFDHIRVQGSLHQVADFSAGLSGSQLLRFLGKYGNEFPANAPPLLLWIRDSLQLS